MGLKRMDWSQVCVGGGGLLAKHRGVWVVESNCNLSACDDMASCHECKPGGMEPSLSPAGRNHTVCSSPKYWGAFCCPAAGWQQRYMTGTEQQDMLATAVHVVGSAVTFQTS